MQDSWKLECYKCVCESVKMDDEDREIAMDELSDWNSDDDEVEWHLGQINV